MRSSLFKFTLAAGLLGLAVAEAKPINVAILRGAAVYIHTSISQGGAGHMQTLLQNPTAANLQNPTIHPDGIRVALFGPSAGGTPSTAEMTAFVGALDTTDVLLVFCNVSVGTVIPVAHRQTVANFIMNKGTVSLHATTDSRNTWSAWDTIHAATFWNHSNANSFGTLYRDTVSANVNAPGYSILSNGLFTNDTVRLQEELFSFNGTSAAIRAKSQLNVLYTLKESSITGGGGQNGGTPYVMGADHPMAWFRTFANGGRFFYSGIGHRLDLYQSNYFHRRQIYNGVIWAAKIDTLSVSIANKHLKAPGLATNYSRLTPMGSALHVELLQKGSHSVELLSIDGKRLAEQSTTEKSVTFEGLSAGTIYAVKVTSPQGVSNRLVTMR